MNHSFFIYGKRLIVVTTLILLAVITFNYYVDPFSIYGRTRLQDGVHVNNPGFSAQVSMGKALAIRQRKPEVLILGSSRVSYSFSLHVPEQYFSTQNIYNGSIPGMVLYEQLRYFQHAVALGPLKQVFIGLDFFQFHGARPPGKTFREERLAVDINNRPAGNATDDLLATLLSVDATLYSIKISTGLVGLDVDTYLPNGFISKENSGGLLEHFIESEGRGYINNKYTVPEYTFNTGKNDFTSFDYFQKLVQLAHDKKIEVYFFISPAHARQWEVIEQLGLWHKWEYWKRELLRITVQEAELHRQYRYPVYDFSGYSDYSTEKVPRTKGATPMRWYTDSSHYRQELGNLVLEQILNPDQAQNFGRILSTENIEAHLETIRAGKRNYQASHLQDVDDIRKLIVKRKKSYLK